MNNITWNSVEEKEMQRVAAYERVRTKVINRNDFKKASLVIPEGAEFHLPLTPPGGGIFSLEILQKPSSKLTLEYLQNAKPDEHGMMIITISLDRDAVLKSLVGMFGGATSTLFLETNLTGANSSTHQKTLFFGSGDKTFDMYSTTILSGEGTNAKIEAKGILEDSAQARFDGGITIRESAKKSTAKLFEHTLLLSSDAKMNAIPGLNIETNDVFAQHSASITRVDDDQLFYCKSRGIEEREAVRLIAEGFLKGMYEDAEGKKEIEHLIEEKLCKV